MDREEATKFSIGIFIGLLFMCAFLVITYSQSQKEQVLITSIELLQDSNGVTYYHLTFSNDTEGTVNSNKIDTILIDNDAPTLKEEEGKNILTLTQEQYDSLFSKGLSID